MRRQRQGRSRIVFRPASSHVESTRAGAPSVDQTGHPTRSLSRNGRTKAWLPGQCRNVAHDERRRAGKAGASMSVASTLGESSEFSFDAALRLEDLIDRNALTELCKSVYALFGIGVR